MSYAFPYAVAMLETGAALVFLAQGNIRLTILWSGYAVAAWALAGVR
jgi:hypothetical protein